MSDDSDLLSFVEDRTGDTYLKIEESLGQGYVRLRIGEAERRQARHDIRSVEDIVIELLRNSRDAGATRIYVATGRVGTQRTLTVLDDGCGIPPSLQERMFEPRVTSKLETIHMDRWGVHGRGMALYSIRENTESARFVCSDQHRGTSFQAVCDCTKLNERSDQWTLPRLERMDDGSMRIGRGPHNILRCVLEFAWEHRDSLTVYMGSATEIAATLAARSSDDSLTESFDACVIPFVDSLRGISDASQLTQISQSLGLVLSERSAHRILAGDIQSVSPCLDLLRPQKPESRKIDLGKDRRGLTIDTQDIKMFSDDVMRSFASLADSYYLCAQGEPQVSFNGHSLMVRIDFQKMDED